MFSLTFSGAHWETYYHLFYITFINGHVQVKFIALKFNTYLIIPGSQTAVSAVLRTKKYKHNHGHNITHAMLSSYWHHIRK